MREVDVRIADGTDAVVVLRHAHAAGRGGGRFEAAQLVADPYAKHRPWVVESIIRESHSRVIFLSHSLKALAQATEPVDLLEGDLPVAVHVERAEDL